VVLNVPAKGGQAGTAGGSGGLQKRKRRKTRPRHWLCAFIKPHWTPIHQNLSSSDH